MKYWNLVAILFIIGVIALFTTCEDDNGSNNLHTHSFGNWITKTEATCTEAKIEKRTCSCSEEETQIVGSPLGHLWDDWDEYLEATVYTEGEERRYCLREICEVFESQTIDTHIHDFEDGWKTINPATCTEKEKQERTCTHTKCVHHETQFIGEPLGHDFIWTLIYFATIDEAGEETEICKICNTDGNSKLIPRLPMNWIAIKAGVEEGQSTFLNNEEIRRIKYINGRFFAVGQNFKIASSIDGINWTNMTNNTQLDIWFHIIDITWGNGMYVAVGQKGRAAYSPDGLNWTVVNVPSFYDYWEDYWIWSVSYGNGRFVAVGAGGRMAYSENGINWTAMQGPFFSSTDSTCIYWINDRFFAGGSSQLGYSFTGINNWTYIADMTGQNNYFGSTIYSITYGNGMFVAVTSDGRIVYSLSGTNWLLATNNILGIGNAIRGVIWGNDRFIAVGHNGRMAHSRDGINWTAIQAGGGIGQSSFESYENIYDIAYGNGKFVAVGRYGSMAYFIH